VEVGALHQGGGGVEAGELVRPGNAAFFYTVG